MAKFTKPKPKRKNKAEPLGQMVGKVNNEFFKENGENIVSVMKINCSLSELKDHKREH